LQKILAAAWLSVLKEARNPPKFLANFS
jgi:hypothetical protein